MPIAVVILKFDPSATPFGVAILWGTLALIGVFIAALILAGVMARAADLRMDDVLFIAIGVVPGAVIGGRIGYLLIHADAFGADPSRLVDPAVGGLELGLAVVGGTLTGAAVASLLEAPVGRWLHVAAAPALLALGAGKLTMVLTGAGQGQPNDAAWATAYLGPGPWASLLPALPSTPSQALEGGATLLILTAVALFLLVGGFRSRDGRLFFISVGLWAVARAIVSTTWRDPLALNELNGGGLVAIAIAVGCFVAFALSSIGRVTAGRSGSDHSEPTGSIVEARSTRSDHP